MSNDQNSKKVAGVSFAEDFSQQFTSFNDAINGFKPFLNQVEVVDPKDIGFSYNGSASFSVGASTYKSTEFGLLSLCKLLKIPNPFVKIIPMDLLQQNIHRLCSEYMEPISITIDSKGSAVGFNPYSYKPLKTFDLLSRIGDRFSSDSENIKVSVTPKNCVVQFTSPIITDLEPKVGDYIKCGLEITNSEVNDIGSFAQLFLLRLVCTNGAVMTDNWGRVKKSTNNKLEYDTVLEQFINGCSRLVADSHQLQEFFKNFDTISLNSEQFVVIFRALSPLLGKDDATTILRSNEDEVKDYVDFEKKRTRWTTNPSEWYGRNPRDTEKNAYDVFNNITETARDTSNITQARRLRMLSGKYVTMLSQQYLSK